MKTMAAETRRHRLTLGGLLKPHSGVLLLGFVAVLVEGAASLAEPWPLKLVLDNVLRAKSAHGWINHLVLPSAAGERLAILKLAALAVLAVAAIGAIAN